ncbi:MAG: hypothetical protein WBP64_16645 [Nitrososphaeraceae archaeon]
MILSQTTSGMQLDESTPLTSDINTTTQKILAVQLSFIDQTQFAYNSIKLYFSDGFLVEVSLQGSVRSVSNSFTNKDSYKT